MSTFLLVTNINGLTSRKESVNIEEAATWFAEYCNQIDEQKDICSLFVDNILVAQKGGFGQTLHPFIPEELRRYVRHDLNISRARQKEEGVIFIRQSFSSNEKRFFTLKEATLHYIQLEVAIQHPTL